MEKSYVTWLPKSAYVILERAILGTPEGARSVPSRLRLFVDDPESYVTVNGRDEPPLHVEIRPMPDKLFALWQEKSEPAWRQFDKANGVYIYRKRSSPPAEKPPHEQPVLGRGKQRARTKTI